MNSRIHRGLIGLALAPALLLGVAPLAEEKEAPPGASGEAPEAKETKAETSKRLSQLLRARFGIDKIDDIQLSAVPDFYEIFIGGQLVYVSADGRYLFQGDVLDMLTDKNLTSESNKRFQDRLAPDRRKRLAEYPDDKTIVFAPEGEPRHTITVATDVSCGYCRKFHREIGELNEAGIKVRYLLFPRSGLGSNSASNNKMTSVWCSDNKADALTRAKAGQAVKTSVCQTPIPEHYRMSQEMGVRGTPSIFTGSGKLIPGYMEAKKLIGALDQDTKEMERSAQTKP